MGNVEGGRYYQDGDPAEPGVPSVVICRRLEDFAPAPLPASGAITGCARCQAAIVFNPAGPHQDRPKVCMQCVGIDPLPIGGPDAEA